MCGLCIVGYVLYVLKKCKPHRIVYMHCRALSPFSTICTKQRDKHGLYFVQGRVKSIAHTQPKHANTKDTSFSKGILLILFLFRTNQKNPTSSVHTLPPRVVECLWSPASITKGIGYSPMPFPGCSEQNHSPHVSKTSG